MSICVYETPKFDIALNVTFEDATATTTFKPPLTQEEFQRGEGFGIRLLEEFHFEQKAIVDCIGRGFQKIERNPEVAKSTDGKFKLTCWGSGTWT